MKRVKQIITSVVVLPVSVYVVYVVMNLALAFTLEAIRVGGVYKDSSDVNVLKQFTITLGSAHNYQSDYQLYYIFGGIMALYGLYNIVTHIFTDMYRDKKVRFYESGIEGAGERRERLVKAVGEGKDAGTVEILEKILDAVTEPGYQEVREPGRVPMYPKEDSVGKTRYEARRGSKRENYGEENNAPKDSNVVNEGFGLRSTSPNNEIAGILGESGLVAPEGWGEDVEEEEEIKIEFGVVDRDNKIQGLISGKK